MGHKLIKAAVAVFSFPFGPEYPGFNGIVGGLIMLTVGLLLAVIVDCL